MTVLTGERGGVVTKLLGILLVLGILATAALYIYGKKQQPCPQRACTSRRATANASPRRSASPPDEASTSRRSCGTTGPSR